MAQLTEFGFRPGDSVFHRMDIRFKLCGMALLSGAALKAGFSGMILLGLPLLWMAVRIRLPLSGLIREIRYFLFLLILVFITRALTTEGTAVTEWMGGRLTREGMVLGGLICCRLMLIVFLGTCFIAVSRPSEIRGGAEWLLAPVPLIPEKRAGVMLSLLMRFIPVIFDQAMETADAQRARGVERRRNPLFRLSCFVIPFLRRVFEDADRLIIAMEARCYSENRTPPRFASEKKDWLFLGCAAILAGTAILL